MSMGSTTFRPKDRHKTKKNGMLELFKGQKPESRSVPPQLSERTLTTTDIESTRSHEPLLFLRKSESHKPQFRLKTHTFDGVPLVLENSFRFIEKVTRETKAVKPYSQMTEIELNEFINKFGEEKLTKYVKEKQLGKDVKRISLEKLIKLGINEKKAITIQNDIINYENKSKIGKHILLMKVNSDKALRKMFELMKGYEVNEIKQFNEMPKDEAHLIAFMAIRTFFAKKRPILINEKKAHELFEGYNQLKNDEIQLMNEVRKFIGSLEQNGVILLRTLKFIHRMISDDKSCYYYCKELFLHTMFSFFYEGDSSKVPKFYFLVDLIDKLIPKKTQSKLERVFESDSLYGGEVILYIEQPSKIPLYMILNQEQLNKECLNTWVGGKLYLTNYRLIWRTSNESLGSMAQCYYFNQVPLKMIFEANAVSGNGSNSSQCPHCIKIISRDNRILLFSMENEQRVISFKERLIYIANKVRNQTMKIDDYEQFYFKNIFENIWEKTATRLGVDIKSPNSLFCVQNNLKDRNRCSFEGITFRHYQLIDETHLEMDEFKRSPILIHRDKSGSYLFKLQYIFCKDHTTSQLKYPDELKQIFTTICTTEIVFVNSTYNTNPSLLKTCDTLQDSFHNKIVKLMNDVNEKTIGELNGYINYLLEYQEIILSVTMNIINKLTHGESIILLPNTKNASEIGIYTSLIELLTDKYYRSFEGFLELIFKEFVQYGYFKTICQYNLYPVHFLVFLKMVHSFIYYYPYQFGFNSTLIHFLYQHCNSGRFSAFEGSSTQGVFVYLYSNKEFFVNNSFVNEECDFYQKYCNKELPLVHCPYFFFRWMNYTYKQTDLFNTSAAVNFDLHERGTLTEIPSYIKDVSKAEVINLSNNPLMIIPECLQVYTTLQKLILSNCKLNCIPKHFFDSLTQLTYLDISNNSGTKSIFFTPLLSSLTNLKYLDLSSQVFFEPNALDKFIFPVNLKTLLLTNCINKLPYSLTKIKELETLDISRNSCINISILPQLTSLKNFILESCEQKTLPIQISFLTYLTKLDVADNEIKELPYWLYEMTQLKDLNLSTNLLKYISIKQTQLTSLTHFDINNNSIKSLPVVHPLLNGVINCFIPPVISKIHVLSSSFGIETMKMITDEWISMTNNSTNNIIFLHSTDEICGTSSLNKKDYFTFIYHDDSSPISFNFSRNDCYLIVFTSKEIETIYYWKYYLNLVLPQQMSVFVLLLADIKSSEKDFIESTVKDTFKQCDFLHLAKGKENSRIMAEKFIEWIKKFKHRWENEEYELLEIDQELLNCEINPPIVNRAQLEKIIETFGINKEKHTRFIDELNQSGTIISSASVLNIIKNNAPDLLKVLPCFDSMEEVFILKTNLFEKIYDIMYKNSTKGIGIMSDIYSKLQWCGNMNITLFSFILFKMEIHNMLCVYFDEWFKKFHLTNNYEGFKQEGGIETLKELLNKPMESQHKLVLITKESITNSQRTNTKISEQNQQLIELKDDSIPESKECIPFVPFSLHSTLSIANSKVIERIWPKQLEKGYNEYAWSFRINYVPPLIYDHILALILVSNSKIINMFQQYVFVEFEDHDQIYYLMIKLEYSRLIIKIRTIANSVTRSLYCISFIGELNKKIKEILSFYSKELATNECVLCPVCIEEGIPDVGEMLVENLRIAIRNSNDTINCQPSISRGSYRQHIVSVTNISIGIQLEVLKSDFSNLMIEGSKVKIKRHLLDDTDYILYEASYNNEQVCMKTFSYEGKNEKGGSTRYLGNVFSTMMREANVAKTVNHPNFLALKGIVLTPLALLVDYCEQNLSLYLHSNSTVDWKTNLDFIIQICTGMKKLHSIKMVHRNLRTSAIMIKVNPITKERYAVIADFGKTTPNYIGNKIEFTKDKREEDISKIAYIAPEVLQDQEFKPEADVYSFGIILWEIAHRLYPYEKNKQSPPLFYQICNGIRPLPNVKTPYSQFNKLVIKCWHQQPTNRPSFASLCIDFQKIRSEAFKLDKKK
ncbi:hypothetical protein ENUP19_0337G0020 [Entamoeba nuttalli]|uniref:Leucine rich repeat-containing protein n=2 Tax=Entamoeba nuttalli TaxID=412467 RepID=K2H0D9_ENTNP|nr:leucine rich repeat-containing protein [Entamoeba nuttalli P19]EKE40948.1 leucine rich repeat-containing protein [Entamoeba nuttalli P19]|eukprot:XP_008856709.1 leucine rich repeat-containing protein [Entamoeba nuttalli P19]